MSLIQTSWKWETGTPQERADTVRRHAFDGRPIPEANLLTLFNLTEVGLRRILGGDIWRPEYDIDQAPQPTPLNSIDARLARLRGQR
jgi:hypothetical protein